MPRFLSDVIDQIINVIPKKEKELIVSLKKPQTSSQYSAPEIQFLFWEETADILASRFGNPEKLNKWQQKVVNIFTNKELGND